ncbi:DUF6414 family protein [Agromyces mariniharenae]|uniref:Uncharacterized protein n=1 Tax=Agromyces mariniharenae TaxID=2604423 RepID=A0A5S4V091_9MICO|nr:DUF6414 family protein [Agromyces mariniharenae]TYL51173.1 hypothetical protein FYC51_18830 [Agromyces mariniharenae]
MASDSKDKAKTFVKVVYFDEESASDLLDIAAGGKETIARDQTRERTAEVEASASAKAAAKFNWLPFFGGSAEAGAAASASALGRSILNKTLSNTILTDYLAKLDELKGIKRLGGLSVSARRDSAAWMKMYTPYMAMMKTDELPVNLAVLDEALEAAKGYYELLAEDDEGANCILRFNIQAFRNNYGLVDLGRMDLVFHGVRVGQASQSSLTMQAEMSPDSGPEVTASQIVRRDDAVVQDEQLDVYDVLLAGVEHDA